MAATRPLVSVYDADTSAVTSEVALPAVFGAPIRADLVHHVHVNMAKNKRQAYAVTKARGLKAAGMQTAAESWGTGRAVSRIPRVPGSGTHRAGQAAFGNMCRGGRMFAPTRVWRKWHRKINTNEKRYAVAAAVAASAVPSLVLARGHRISEVPEFPLVLNLKTLDKTAKAYKLLERFGATEDVDRCDDSKKIRAGKGKMRNRRYVMRRGPLVVYGEGDDIEKAFRALPGVELAHVERLNLLQLAPGGHTGRFIVWTETAFKALDSVFGAGPGQASELKSGYSLPRTIMTTTDLSRLINSDEVQSVVNAKKEGRQVKRIKRNPLKNKDEMYKLNPYAKAHRAAEARAEKQRIKKKGNAKAARRAQYAALTAE